MATNPAASGKELCQWIVKSGALNELMSKYLVQAQQVLLEGTPPKVSKVEIPLEVTPEIPAGGCQVDLAFSGRFGGREITPAVVPLIQTGAMLAENVGREPEWRSPARWRANSSGEMEISEKIEKHF